MSDQWTDQSAIIDDLFKLNYFGPGFKKRSIQPNLRVANGAPQLRNVDDFKIPKEFEDAYSDTDEDIEPDHNLIRLSVRSVFNKNDYSNEAIEEHLRKNCHPQDRSPTKNRRDEILSKLSPSVRTNCETSKSFVNKPKFPIRSQVFTQKGKCETFDEKKLSPPLNSLVPKFTPKTQQNTNETVTLEVLIISNSIESKSIAEPKPVRNPRKRINVALQSILERNSSVGNSCSETAVEIIPHAQPATADVMVPHLQSIPTAISEPSAAPSIVSKMSSYLQDRSKNSKSDKQSSKFSLSSISDGSDRSTGSVSDESGNEDELITVGEKCKSWMYSNEASGTYKYDKDILKSTEKKSLLDNYEELLQFKPKSRSFCEPKFKARIQCTSQPSCSKLETKIDYKKMTTNELYEFCVKRNQAKKNEDAANTISNEKKKSLPSLSDIRTESVTKSITNNSIGGCEKEPTETYTNSNWDNGFSWRDRGNKQKYMSPKRNIDNTNWRSRGDSQINDTTAISSTSDVWKTTNKQNIACTGESDNNENVINSQGGSLNHFNETSSHSTTMLSASATKIPQIINEDFANDKDVLELEDKLVSATATPTTNSRNHKLYPLFPETPSDYLSIESFMCSSPSVKSISSSSNVTKDQKDNSHQMSKLTRTGNERKKELSPIKPQTTNSRFLLHQMCSETPSDCLSLESCMFSSPSYKSISSVPSSEKKLQEDNIQAHTENKEDAVDDFDKITNCITNGTRSPVPSSCSERSIPQWLIQDNFYQKLLKTQAEGEPKDHKNTFKSPVKEVKHSPSMSSNKNVPRRQTQEEIYQELLKLKSENEKNNPQKIDELDKNTVWGFVSTKIKKKK